MGRSRNGTPVQDREGATSQATASEGRVQERSTRSGLTIFVLSQGEDQQRAENSPLSFP